MALMNSALHNQHQALFSPSVMTFKSSRAGFYTNLWNSKKERGRKKKKPNIFALHWLVCSLGYFGPQVQTDLTMEDSGPASLLSLSKEACSAFVSPLKGPIFLGLVPYWCQYFGYLVWRVSSLEKTMMLGKTEGRRRRGQQRMRWLDGIINSMDLFEQTPGHGKAQGSLACCSP